MDHDILLASFHPGAQMPSGRSRDAHQSSREGVRGEALPNSRRGRAGGRRGLELEVTFMKMTSGRGRKGTVA